MFWANLLQDALSVLPCKK